MEGRLLLKDGALVDGEGRVRRGMSVLIEKDRIAQVAEVDRLPGLPGDWEVACRGRWIVPGFVDGYALPLENALSGQPLTGATRPLSDAQVSELTTSEWTSIVLAQMARSVLAGVSLSVQHTRFPGRTRECLQATRQAAELLGLRVYAGATDDSDAGADAIVQSLHETARHPTVRTAWGVDDSQTLTEARWKSVVDSTPSGVLVLDGNSKALQKDRAVAERSVVLASDVQAPEGSGVLHIRRPTVHSSGAVIQGLGTLGITSFANASALAQSASPGGVSAAALFNPQGLHTVLFGAPVGQVAVGHAADVLVLDDLPTDNPETVWCRLPQLTVAWHIVGGQVLVREGQLLTAPYLEVLRDELQATQAWRARF